MTLLAFLRQLNVFVPPCESFPAGLLSEASGEPTDATSPFFFAYVDTDTDKIYFDPERSGAWVEITSAADLAEGGGSILTTDT